MNRMYWLVFLLLVFLASPALAEYYKYVDGTGKVRFTDDLNQVPADQRAKVKEYTEIVSAADTKESDINRKDATPSAPVPSQTADLEAAKSGLDSRKEQLDREYEALMEQKKRLEEIQAGAKSKKAITQYNEDVNQLNLKIQTYEEKRRKFNAEVDQYNSEVNRLNQQTRQSQPDSDNN